MRHTYGMFGAVASQAGHNTWSGVPARPTFGGFGSLGAAESIESIDAIADRDGSDEEILDATSSEYVEDYNQGIPPESYQGFGAVAKWQDQFCSNGTPKTPQQAYDARENMRKQMAAHGIKTYPGTFWKKEEQDAWNAFNVSRGLKPMLFGKYPMGTQCDALNKGPFTYGMARPVAPHLSGYGADAAAGGTVSQSLGMFALQRLIGAAAGYYIGSKLGPKGSHAGIAGAAATLIAGPLGLAGVAAYYSR